MDAVLPLTLRDVERASLLLESLAANFVDLGELWVVCPDRELSAVAHALQRPSTGLCLRYVGETSLVPELELTPRLDGWYRQQLVKLAVHERVRSQLYLTLDADVICTKRVTSEELGPGGRAPCHTTLEDLHPDWYRGSEAVLGLRAVRTRVSHNVTPAVLHRDGVTELAQYLQRRAGLGIFSGGVRGIKQRIAHARAHRSAKVEAGWRLYLAAGAPWTEYALYYTFLEASGGFERFHTHSPSCIYDLTGSFWRADRRAFAGWAPKEARGVGAPWFVIVQSNTQVPPAQVRQKLQGYWQHV
jgi:hypothetical protein